MKPLFVLLSVFIIGLGVFKIRNRKIDWQLAGRVAMSAMLIFTSFAHFIFTEGMTAMIPDVFSYKKQIVYLTGVLEMLFAFGILIPKVRKIMGWALIAFFIAVLPANIKASMENINYQTGEFDGNGIQYLWFRIPLQIFFIIWVFYTSIKIYKPDVSLK